MHTKIKYWKIECTKHLKTLFQAKINANHISEKKLVEFIRTLISKHALSNEEILEQHLKIPFTKRKDYIQIVRTNSNTNGNLQINFITQIADISIIAYLTN